MKPFFAWVAPVVILGISVIDGLGGITNRINCGGPGVQAWAADRGCLAGTTAISKKRIANAGAVPPKVYQSWRVGGKLTYNFRDISNGVYRVRLHFAELLYTKAGERLFKVIIEGNTVTPKLDIVARTGRRYRALRLTYTVTVMDDNGLQISGVGLDGANAVFNGIEIIPIHGGAIAYNPATTAANVLAYVGGGNSAKKEIPTNGGKGGQVIVKTGVPNLDVGDGRDGPLTSNITLKSGTYNYKYVNSLFTGGFPPTITIDGDVIIRCKGIFVVHNVVGVFRPDQAKPPSVQITAGAPYVTISGVRMKLLHSASFTMSASAIDPNLVNSDGSGLDGGNVIFYTSQPGDLFCGGVQAWGGMGQNGGNGGRGGIVRLTANGKDRKLLSGGVFAFGGPAIGSLNAGGYGGTGGNGGSITLAASNIVNALWQVDPFVFWLDVSGGDGGMAFMGSAEHPVPGAGGKGGKGGKILVTGKLASPGSFPAKARGGDGGSGGMAYHYEQIGGNSRPGYPGGKGGNGGYAGVISGLKGIVTPGNGGNGGMGGRGEAGIWSPTVPIGFITKGGDGGAGGNGGHSGGKGGKPGKGGEGGPGGSGNPNGQNGPAGINGAVGY